MMVSMSALDKAYRCASFRFCDSVKLRFKFAVALLFLASASLAGAQTLQTIYSFTNGWLPNAVTLGND